MATFSSRLAWRRSGSTSCSTPATGLSGSARMMRRHSTEMPLPFAGALDQRDQRLLDLGAVLLRDQPAVEPHARRGPAPRWCRMPPEISPTVSLGEPMPGDFDFVFAQPFALLVERGEDAGRGFERVGAAFGHRGMRLPALHRDFEMQHAVVRGDDRVGKAGADREVGLGDLLVEQPFGPDEAAGFLVVGEMQFDRAVEARGVVLQRQQRERIGGEIRLRHRGAAAVDRAACSTAP